MRVMIWIGFLGCFVSMGSRLGAYAWYLDLLSHFRIQYIALIVFALCVTLFWKYYKSAAVFLVCLGVHVFDVAKSQSDHDFETELEGPRLRIMSSNLLASNTDYDAHVQIIKSVNPDVIVFQEYTYAWQAALSFALGEYPYKVEVPAHHAFGNALYSKYPLQNARTPALVVDSRKSVDATMVIDETTLRVFGTHPPPPMSQRMHEERNLHLQRLGDNVQSYTAPMIVLGDLNISPWSTHFREFVSNAKLYDARRGQGLLPTWSIEMPLLQIPIDHILFNERVRVLSMQTSSDVKSDHKVIWADITVAQ